MRSAFTFFFLEIKVWMVKGIVLYSPITWLESPIKWLYVIVVLLKRLGASEKTMVGDAIFTMLSSMRHEKQTNEQTNKQTFVPNNASALGWRLTSGPSTKELRVIRHQDSNQKRATATAALQGDTLQAPQNLCSMPGTRTFLSYVLHIT